MNPPANHTTVSTSASRSSVVSGYALIVLAGLTVALMAMHPTSGTHDTGEFAARAARGVPGNAAVHGVLIVLMLLMASCFLAMVDVLGARRLIVRVGLVALIVGTTGGVAAGLLNGFIVPSVAARFAGADPGAIDALRPVLLLAGETNAACARVSVLGLSLAAVAWSIGLLAAPGRRRIAGVAGLVCGVLPVSLLATGHLPMNVAGFGLFVVAHAVWAAIAGVVLIGSRPDA